MSWLERCRLKVAILFGCYGKTFKVGNLCSTSRERRLAGKEDHVKRQQGKKTVRNHQGKKTMQSLFLSILALVAILFSRVEPF